MSNEMNQVVETVKQVSHEKSPSNDHTDLEASSSSCLSEIEDKEPEGKKEVTKDLEATSDDLGNTSEDSEAETERLERSPIQSHTSQHVFLNLEHHQKLDRGPSTLYNQSEPNGNYKIFDEENLDKEPSISPKNPANYEVEEEISMKYILLENPRGETAKKDHAEHVNTRKRKRSTVDDTEVDDEVKPSQNRNNSLSNPADNYSIELDTHREEENSDLTTQNISGESETLADNEPADEFQEPFVPKNDELKTNDLYIPTLKRECRKKKSNVSKITIRDVDPDKNRNNNATTNFNNVSNVNNDNNVNKVGTKNSDNARLLSEEEAEIISRNEEEIERKKIALNQLIELEKQFSAFRDRLYQERMEQLNCEEAVLRETNPSHPEYLAMIKCIDARRDEKIHKANKLKEYEMESLKKVAVAQRSQILAQYQQEVRDIREKKLEQIGEQWYKIQHDRRSFSGISPEYVLKFPTRKSQQITNHVAYSSEVSILSGIAKYVGFPAAPIMAPATPSELEEDLEKINMSVMIG